MCLEPLSQNQLNAVGQNMSLVPILYFMEAEYYQ
jgi:hypothetical protein